LEKSGGNSIKVSIDLVVAAPLFQQKFTLVVLIQVEEDLMQRIVFTLT
jgi:hypothetical protein